MVIAFDDKKPGFPEYVFQFGRLIYNVIHRYEEYNADTAYDEQ